MRVLASLWRRWYRTGDIEASLGRYNAASLTGKLYNLVRGLARLGAGGLRVAKAALCDSWRKPGAFVASFYTSLQRRRADRERRRRALQGIRRAGLSLK